MHFSSLFVRHVFYSMENIFNFVYESFSLPTETHHAARPWACHHADQIQQRRRFNLLQLEGQPAECLVFHKRRAAGNVQRTSGRRLVHGCGLDVDEVHERSWWHEIEVRKRRKKFVFEILLNFIFFLDFGASRPAPTSEPSKRGRRCVAATSASQATKLLTPPTKRWASTPSCTSSTPVSSIRRWAASSRRCRCRWNTRRSHPCCGSSTTPSSPDTRTASSRHTTWE